MRDFTNCIATILMIMNLCIVINNVDMFNFRKGSIVNLYLAIMAICIHLYRWHWLKMKLPMAINLSMTILFTAIIFAILCEIIIVFYGHVTHYETLDHSNHKVKRQITKVKNDNFYLNDAIEMDGMDDLVDRLNTPDYSFRDIHERVKRL